MLGVAEPRGKRSKYTKRSTVELLLTWEAPVGTGRRLGTKKCTVAEYCKTRSPLVIGARQVMGAYFIDHTPTWYGFNGAERRPLIQDTTSTVPLGANKLQQTPFPNTPRNLIWSGENKHGGYTTIIMGIPATAWIIHTATFIIGGEPVGVEHRWSTQASNLIAETPYMANKITTVRRNFIYALASTYVHQFA